jgi:RimJ/RimL family protein N-acetyltransferase
MSVVLRPIEDPDLPIFFQHMQHEPALHMAAFVHEDPTDRAAFDAHWAKLRGSEKVLKRTILHRDLVVGSIMSFDMEGDREITYWIGHEHWGIGIATDGLRLFLELEHQRPLNGRAAKDNLGSIRVMERCGFAHVCDERGFANARGEEIDEVVMVLR